MEKIHMIEKKLYDATLKGDVETLEVLMREDEPALARVSISSCFNQTPLHVAAMLGHFGFSKSLLHYKPDFAGRPEVRFYTLDRGETILHTCVMYNRLEPLIRLLEPIAVDEDFTNVKDESGSTILHTATALKRTQHVKYLLTRSVQGVNEVNGNGLSALDIIEQMHKDVKTIEIKELLISTGASRAKGFGNKANQMTLEVQTSQQPRYNRRAKLLRKVTKWSIFKKKGENKGNLLLVAVTIIAAMAYQAAISPPGGVIGIDAKESNGPIIKPGTSILAHYHPDENRLFWRFNTVTFIASLSIVFFFVSRGT
ncbi:PGG domain-containing protein [Heracleum sosnowskyi]|uniref:PGG domain-containing protein n=1 Tax=Heracleum sosnowskyi TaxID=360622 RepID=A0AAD8JKE9_9APIA|nr:PGG domain-containing protein [Heracleum sosnowskyi]